MQTRRLVLRRNDHWMLSTKQQTIFFFFFIFSFPSFIPSLILFSSPLLKPPSFLYYHTLPSSLSFFLISVLFIFINNTVGLWQLIALIYIIHSSYSFAFPFLLTSHPCYPLLPHKSLSHTHSSLSYLLSHKVQLPPSVWPCVWNYPIKPGDINRGFTTSYSDYPSLRIC